ncbi:MAG: SDR family oxidoreductase [Chloroflexi bacterium]|nr:SDR family oxidoreductase [Chloroflexota bacterium]
MGSRLQGKVAVVTGSGRGIGRSVALALAAEGARVVVNDTGSSLSGEGLDPAPAQSVAGEIQAAGGQTAVSHHSVGTVEGGQAIVETALERFGRLDILVNNAGNWRPGTLLEMGPEDWLNVLATHLTGAFYVTRAAAPVMKSQHWGRILCVSSSAALGRGRHGSMRRKDAPNMDGIAYVSAKGGLLAFVRYLAKELDGTGVTVNALMPIADTRMMRADQELRKAKGVPAALPPERRDPDDVAPLFAYLASDEAAAITGRTFFVEKGHIVLYQDPSPVWSLYRRGRWTVDDLAEALPAML